MSGIEIFWLIARAWRSAKFMIIYIFIFTVISSMGKTFFFSPIAISEPGNKLSIRGKFRFCVSRFCFWIVEWKILRFGLKRLPLELWVTFCSLYWSRPFLWNKNFVIVVAVSTWISAELLKVVDKALERTKSYLVKLREKVKSIWLNESLQNMLISIYERVCILRYLLNV